MSSDFHSALYKPRKRILKKSKIVIFFLSFFFFSNEANSRTIRHMWTEKVPKCFSLSCEAEVVSKFQAMNRRVLTELKTMLGRPLSLQLCLYRQCISRTTTRRGYQSVSLLLAIVKNCLKRLSKAHTTQTKPGPSHGRPDRRPPTTTHRARSG